MGLEMSIPLLLNIKNIFVKALLKLPAVTKWRTWKKYAKLLSENITSIENVVNLFNVKASTPIKTYADILIRN